MVGCLVNSGRDGMENKEDERYDWVMDHIDKHTSMVKPNAPR